MSSHALLSPSAASRWLNCTPAPRLEAELPESTSEYAAEGTLAHSVCELLGRKKFTIVKPSAHNAALKKLKKEALWDDEMLTTAATYVEHLMERSMAFPGKGLNFITMESQERVRGHALFCYILILKKELMNMTEDVVNAGYTIIERFPVDEQGFAIGHSETAPAPYVTWQFRTADKNHFFWGHYAGTKEAAYEDYRNRING